jgi:RNA exonuclease NGL2
LFGDPLLSSQEQAVLNSRVIHATIDPTVLNTLPTKAREDDDEASDPDRVITNARPAIPEDGLLTIPDIVAWFAKLPRLRSAYCEGLRRAKEIGIELETYGTRELLSPGRKGFDEPEYTSYTFYWKSVLGESLSLQSIP